MKLMRNGAALFSTCRRSFMGASSVKDRIAFGGVKEL